MLPLSNWDTCQLELGSCNHEREKGGKNGIERDEARIKAFGEKKLALESRASDDYRQRGAGRGWFSEFYAFLFSLQTLGLRERERSVNRVDGSWKQRLA